MSEHAWVQEQVAVYLAGGLDAQEAERFETHVRDCPVCVTSVPERSPQPSNVGWEACSPACVPILVWNTAPSPDFVP